MADPGARLTMSQRTPSADKVLQVWDQSGHRRIAVAFREQLFAFTAELIVILLNQLMN